MTAGTAPAPTRARVAAPTTDADRARGGAGGWLGRHWWSLLLLVAATWGLLWPYSQRPWSGLASWGDPVQQYWSMAWAVHALRTDPTQLFNGNIFYPYPYTLAYADHLLGATIPVLPVILLTGNVVLGFNLAVLLAYFLSALAAYLLLSDLTGSRLAGVAAALPYGFAPYLLGQINHLNVIFAGPLALGLWATLRLWRGGGWGWAALLGIAIPWQAGVSAYFFYAQLIALGTALVYLALAERPALTRRALPRLGAGLALGLLAAVPVLWPYLQITREFGTVRSFDEVIQWSGVPRQYLGVTGNNLTWGQLLRRWSGGNPERFLFPGLVAPLLALAGLALSRRRERWLFGALVVVGFILTMGPYQDIGEWRVPLPYLILYRVVPGFSGMRVTTRFVILVILGLAGLAGLGVEAIVRRWTAPAVPRPRRKGKNGARAAERGQLPVQVLPGWRRASPLLGVTALVLMVGAYGIDYHTRTGMTSPPGGAIEAPAYRWLAENGTGPVAEIPYPPTGMPQAMPDLIATAHWRPLLGGFSGFEPPAFNEVADTINRFPDPAAIELLQGLGIEHLLLHRADLTGERLAALDATLPRETRVREVARFGDDVLFAVAPDPWLAQLAGAVPAGEAVALPDLAASGMQQELLTVFLRRAGHDVWGSGEVSYHRFALPDDGALPASAFLPAGDDPYLYGWLPEEASLSRGGLTLYRRDAAARAATLLNDPALPRATCPNCAALGFRLTSKGVESVAADGAGGGASGDQSALLAFVNTRAGEITIQAGGASRREQVPAGLIVYRAAGLAAGATVRIDAPVGGTLTPRWARLIAGASAPTGVVAARPVVMLTGTLAEHDDASVTLDLRLFPGANAGQASYALSLDIYRRPYGTHPDGHYGYWTIAVPADGQSRAVGLNFDIASRAAEATIDGNWASIASWSGPPTSGLFRASLVLSSGDTVIGSVPAFEFELSGWRSRNLERTLPRERIYFFPPVR